MRRSLVTGLLFVLLASLAHAAGEEQRCIDLGSDCLCSEPMNANDGVVSGSNAGCGPGNCWFPSDTSGSKICNNAVVWDSTSICWTNASRCGSMAMQGSGTAQMVPDTSVSSGEDLPGVSWVWQYEHAGGETQWRHTPDSTNLDVTGETICTRFYTQYNSTLVNGLTKVFDPSVLSAANDHKMGRMANGSDPNRIGIQCIGTTFSPFDCIVAQDGTAGVAFTSTGNFSHTQGPNNWWTGGVDSGTGASHQQCTGNWCRVEYCVDHYTSGPNANQLGFRLRVVRLQDTGGAAGLEEIGRHTNVPFVTDGPGSATASTGEKWASISTQQNVGEWQPPGSHETLMAGSGRWVSHLMIVRTATDDTLWIGAASEIEAEAEAAGTHIMSGGSTAGGSF